MGSISFLQGGLILFLSRWSIQSNPNDILGWLLLRLDVHTLWITTIYHRPTVPSPMLHCWIYFPAWLNSLTISHAHPNTMEHPKACAASGGRGFHELTTCPLVTTGVHTTVKILHRLLCQRHPTTGVFSWWVEGVCSAGVVRNESFSCPGPSRSTATVPTMHNCWRSGVALSVSTACTVDCHCCLARVPQQRHRLLSVWLAGDPILEVTPETNLPVNTNPYDDKNSISEDEKTTLDGNSRLPKPTTINEDHIPPGTFPPSDKRRRMSVETPEPNQQTSTTGLRPLPFCGRELPT